MEWIMVVLLGVLAGTHTATWGMFKDAPHEGFTYLRYSRSILVSTVVAPIAYAVTGLNAYDAGDLVVLFGLVYVLERGLTEFWKTYVRTEDQSKYFIPMQFHVFGKVVHSRAVRLAVGIPHAAVIVSLLLMVIGLNRRFADQVPLWVVALTLGSLGGWVSAFFGAWKDAPLEGFETFKFFRSPAVAATYALLLTNFTSSWALIALAAEGFTVATLETWKTFFFPSKPRGKFAGKPILFPQMLKMRQYFVPIYVFIWITVVGGFVVAFMRDGV
jgi:hypothetical protein